MVYLDTIKMLMSLLSLDWLKHTVCRYLRIALVLLTCMHPESMTLLSVEMIVLVYFFWIQTIWICKRTAVFLWGAFVWFHRLHNLQRWKFLSSDCVVCEISVLYKLQAPVVSDLSRKFVVKKSVCQMKHLVREFFYVTELVFFKY